MIQKDKTRVDIYGERFRTRASQITPGLRAVASYINEHREVVLEQTAMEIAATLNTSDAHSYQGYTGSGVCRAA